MKNTSLSFFHTIAGVLNCCKTFEDAIALLARASEGEGWSYTSSNDLVRVSLLNITESEYYIPTSITVNRSDFN